MKVLKNKNWGIGINFLISLTNSKQVLKFNLVDPTSKISQAPTYLISTKYFT